MAITKRKAVLVVGAGLLAVGISGCSIDKYSEPFKDAPRGSTNNGPADVLTMPDGFSNVSAKCDGTTRVYVVYHGDNKYGSVAVSPNSSQCGGSN
jgi:hypothetical protein